MNTDLETLLRVVSAYADKKLGRKRPAIEEDTALFHEGLIDSFGMAEIISAYEAATGTKIPEGALLPDDFESPRVLLQRIRELA